MPILASVYPYLIPPYTPLGHYLPWAPLDIYGAIRLSQIVYWVSKGAVGTESRESDSTCSKSGNKAQVLHRPGVLQECFGILIVLFGGETFLGRFLI